MLENTLSGLDGLITHGLIDYDEQAVSGGSPIRGDKSSPKDGGNSRLHVPEDLKNVFFSGIQDEEQTTLIDEIVENVCDCYLTLRIRSAENSDIVFHVVQVLLNCFILSDSGMHLKALSNILFIFFDITLNSTREELRSAAKAALVRICNTVTSRVEHSYVMIDYSEALDRPEIGSEEIDDIPAAALREECRTGEAQRNGDALENTDSFFTQARSGARHRRISLTDHNACLARVMSHTVKVLSRASLYYNPRIGGRDNSKARGSIGSDGETSLLLAKETKMKRLAAEFILTILTSAGMNVRSKEFFLDLVKRHVCLIVVDNMGTADPGLFEFACSIFLVLVGSYRFLLKHEVEHIVAVVFAQILNKNTLVLWKKLLVVKTLKEICKNSYVLTDIYRIYDCDLESVSLFEKIISICCKTFQTRPSHKSGAGLLGIAASAVGIDTGIEEIKAKENEIRSMSLSCLANIVLSMRAWAADSGYSLDLNAVSSDSERVSSAKCERSTRSLDYYISSANSERIKNPDVSENDSRSISEPTTPRMGASPKIFSKNPLTDISSDFAFYKENNRRYTRSEDDSTNDTGAINPKHLIERKKLLIKSIKIFNINHRDGISIMINNSFIEDNPSSIASFLFNANGLSKTSIGECIGANTPLAAEVLDEFMKWFDFENKELVGSLRIFLSSFRLPGEAQIIDRILQKFSERYFKCNPDPSLPFDSIYTLSFSIIMLNTDLHSGQIRNKITLKQFINNHKGIDNVSFSDELLTSIYENIRANEIKQPDATNTNRLAAMARDWGDSNRNFGQSPQTFLLAHNNSQEAEAMDIKNGASQNTAAATNSEIAKHMLKAYVWPINVTFSAIFDYDDYKESGDTSAHASIPNDIDECLLIYMECTYLCILFKMDEELLTLLDSLSRMVGIQKGEPIGLNGYKALCTIVNIANVMGGYLGAAWNSIMLLILRLYDLKIHFAGLTAADYDHLAHRNFSGASRHSMRSKAVSTPLSGNDKYKNDDAAYHSHQRLDTLNSKDLASNKDLGGTTDSANHNLNPILTIADLLALIERFFTDSSLLKLEPALHVIRSVCIASLTELGFSNTNRESVLMPVVRFLGKQSGTLMMVKVAEITCYNMERPAQERMTICYAVSEYFKKVLCHGNTSLIVSAVNFIRLIIMKTTEFSDTDRDNSQSMMMSTLGHAAAVHQSNEVLQALLFSIMDMIKRAGHRITTSWGDIFSAITIISEKRGSHPTFASNISDILRLIFKHDHLQVILECNKFPKLINSICELGVLENLRENEKLATHCVILLKESVNFLASNCQKDPKDKNANGYSSSSCDTAKPYNFLDCVLALTSSCCKVMENLNFPVCRVTSIEILSLTLRLLSARVKPQGWIDVQRHIFDSVERVACPRPVLDNSASKVSIKEGTSDVSVAMIQNLLQVYSRAMSLSFEDIVCYRQGYIFKSFLDSLAKLIMVDNVGMREVGIKLTHDVIRRNVAYFCKYEYTWDIVEGCLENIYESTVPRELFNPEYMSSVCRNSGKLGAHNCNSAHPYEGITGTNEDSRRQSADAETLSSSFRETVMGKCSSHISFLNVLSNFCSIQMIIPANYDRDTTFRVANSAGSQDTISSRSAPAASAGEEQHKGHFEVPVAVLLPGKLFDYVTSSIYESYTLARSFNNNEDLRCTLYECHLVTSIPSLTRQELCAASGYLELMFLVVKNYLQKSPFRVSDERAGRYLESFASESLKILQRFSDLMQSQGKYKDNSIALWIPSISGIASSLSIFISYIGSADYANINRENVMSGFNKLASNMYKYYEIGLGLTVVNVPVLHTAVASLMMAIGEVYIKPASLCAVRALSPDVG